MVRRSLGLYQRHDAQAALVAMCLRVAPAGSPGLDLASTISCLLLPLPCEIHH